jgi:hypothetical protein
VVQFIYASLFVLAVIELWRIGFSPTRAEEFLQKLGLVGRLVVLAAILTLSAVHLKWLGNKGIFSVIAAFNSYFVLLVDTSIHEFGHFLFMPLGRTACILGGSLFQCLFPLAIVVWCLCIRCGFLASLSLFWLGHNMIHVAWYMSTARARAGLNYLSLDQNPDQHDWYQLFSKVGLLELDTKIALVMRIAAIAVILLSAVFLFAFTRSSKTESSPVPTKEAPPPAAE